MIQSAASRSDRCSGKALVVLAFVTGFAAASLINLPVSNYGKEPVSLWGAVPQRAPATAGRTSAALKPRMIPNNLRLGRVSQIPHAFGASPITVRADDIEAKCKKMIADNLSVDEAKVTNEASFIGDLGADSLDAVELLMALEEEFGVEIPEEEATKLTTVQAVIDYAKAKTG